MPSDVMFPYYLEICVVVLGVLMLCMELFSGRRSRGKIAMSGVVGLGVILALMIFSVCPPGDDLQYWGIYYYDKWAAFYKGLALLATLLVLVMAREFAPVFKHYTSQDEEESGLGEFYCLPVFVCAGLMWMASAKDLVTIFVSLELVTMGFYVLVAFLRRNVGSLEAGVKYLVLGALSTGFLVYGIAWTYGVSGTFSLEQLGDVLASGDISVGVVMFAFALLLVGIGFKIAVVPFQIWVPDVYQGAAMPVTAYLSVASKAAGFIVLLRVIDPFLAVPSLRDPVVYLIVFVTCATLIYGNLAAISQKNIKRLLAYSSIAHAGFLLMALPALRGTGTIHGPGAESAIAFYLAGYLLMTMLCFLVLTLVRVATDGEDLAALEGLGRRAPLLAFAMLVGVASLAGIPLTVGFFGKFFLFNIAIQNAMQSGLWVVVFVAVLGAATGFYYYFKIIRAMYWEVGVNEGGVSEIRVGRVAMLCIWVLMVAVLFFGIFPASLLGLTF
ncbi:MAG: NADH-quinone oxidoreductase subunit N [Verrucomicrobiaceae bacterium]|nr:NADH-quinone oxidoreductase subunit N [Verrucomicrobiaceae bacterium]